VQEVSSTSRPTTLAMPPHPWYSPPPRSWAEVYAIITLWLLVCLALAFLCDWLKGIL